MNAAAAGVVQKRKPKAKATREAKKVGTNTVASEAGLGAGASAAATPFAAETATITITNATKNIFIDSISEKVYFEFARRERTRSRELCLELERKCEGKGQWRKGMR
ncbi:hypothetical protein M9H77_15802 [Catharanthus roseus]|uniref:Uncharacterized protein n=1 Tax=Catharanthus roseus TaxID=4058 RepID=A0ACC0AYI6_CATRO|nr:hypothetical protein M9H77_15802 [Catharanthus roseus]